MRGRRWPSGLRPCPRTPSARILLSVLVGQGTFSELCEIELTRRPLPPDALGDLLPAAVFETIIFDGPNRVLSVSDKRSFTGALRRGSQVRDRTCTGEACVVSALKCQIDHAVAHSDGGPTSEVNGQCCCDVHNGRKGARSAGRANRDPDRALRNLPNLRDPP